MSHFQWLFLEYLQSSKLKIVCLFCHISVERGLWTLDSSFVLSFGKCHCRWDRMYIVCILELDARYRPIAIFFFCWWAEFGIWGLVCNASTQLYSRKAYKYCAVIRWPAGSRPNRIALPQWNLHLKIYAHTDIQTTRREEQNRTHFHKHALIFYDRNFFWFLWCLFVFFYVHFMCIFM